MPIHAVILDLGNVLVLHDNARLFRAFAAKAHLTPEETARRLEHLWLPMNRGELDGEGIRRGFERALGVPFDAPTFFELWNCHFTVHAAVLPWVEQLFGRVRVVLLSNTNALHAQYCLAQLPILKRFDARVLSNEVHLVKPEPGIYREALRRAGSSATEAVFFDDVPEYVAGARAVGLSARVFTTAEAFAQDLRELGILPANP